MTGRGSQQPSTGQRTKRPNRALPLPALSLCGAALKGSSPFVLGVALGSTQETPLPAASGFWFVGPVITITKAHDGLLSLGEKTEGARVRNRPSRRPQMRWGPECTQSGRKKAKSSASVHPEGKTHHQNNEKPHCASNQYRRRRAPKVPAWFIRAYHRKNLAFGDGGSGTHPYLEFDPLRSVISKVDNDVCPSSMRCAPWFGTPATHTTTTRARGQEQEQE